MQCSNCKKQDVSFSWWEKTRYDLMCRLFPEEVRDLQASSHTQGVGVGYKLGFKACSEHSKTQDEIIASLAKGECESWLQKYEP